MSEVILTKNCKTSQKDPPPKKKLPLSQKGPMIIQWRSLDFNCGTGFWYLQLFSSYVPVRPIFDQRSTPHDNFVIVYSKKDHKKNIITLLKLLWTDIFGGRWVVNFPLKEVRLLRDRPLLRNFQLACSILTADLIKLGNGRKHWSPNWYWEYYSKE